MLFVFNRFVLQYCQERRTNMRKVSNVFFIIGIVNAFLDALLFAILSGVFFFFGSEPNKQIIINAINDGTIKTNIPGTAEEIATVVAAIFTAVGVVMLFFLIFALVAGVLTIMAKTKQAKGFLIATIVFAVLGGSYFTIAACVLALIANARESRPQPNVIDVSQNDETTTNE